MATTRTATLEELTKLATEFVTQQKGLWDHETWTDFLSKVQNRGFDISGEMQSKLGELLEAMKQFYSAASTTTSVENAMKAVVDDSVAFVREHKGVWGHKDWEDFVKTARKNTLNLSEGATDYLGGVLETIKVFYPISPVAAANRRTSAAETKPAAASRPAPAAAKKAEKKPIAAKVVKKTAGAKKTSPKSANKKDDLTAIDGIGPALAKKLNGAGIASFAQVAALSDADIEHLEKDIIKFSGRIKRDDWVGQAKKLS